MAFLLFARDDALVQSLVMNHFPVLEEMLLFFKLQKVCPMSLSASQELF